MEDVSRANRAGAKVAVTQVLEGSVSSVLKSERSGDPRTSNTVAEAGRPVESARGRKHCRSRVDYEHNTKEKHYFNHSSKTTKD